MTEATRRTASMKVTWLDERREPQHAANPACPDGIDVDCSGNAKETYTLSLPTPRKAAGNILWSARSAGAQSLLRPPGTQTIRAQ